MTQPYSPPPPPPVQRAASPKPPFWKRTWVLVLASLVVGIGIGSAAGGSEDETPATAEGQSEGSQDPTASDEYKKLQTQLAESEGKVDKLEAAAATSSSPDPEPAKEEPSPEVVEPPAEPAEDADDQTLEVDGWTLTEGDITKDFVGDFEARFRATNNSGDSGIAYFTMTLLKGSDIVASLDCIGTGNDVDEGETTTVECTSVDNFKEGSWDSVELEYAGF